MVLSGEKEDLFNDSSSAMFLIVYVFVIYTNITSWSNITNNFINAFKN